MISLRHQTSLQSATWTNNRSRSWTAVPEDATAASLRSNMGAAHWRQFVPQKRERLTPHCSAQLTQSLVLPMCVLLWKPGKSGREERRFSTALSTCVCWIVCLMSPEEVLHLCCAHSATRLSASWILKSLVINGIEGTIHTHLQKCWTVPLREKDLDINRLS